MDCLHARAAEADTFDVGMQLPQGSDQVGAVHGRRWVRRPRMNNRMEHPCLRRSGTARRKYPQDGKKLQGGLDRDGVRSSPSPPLDKFWAFCLKPCPRLPILLRNVSRYLSLAPRIPLRTRQGRGHPRGCRPFTGARSGRMSDCAGCTGQRASTLTHNTLVSVLEAIMNHPTSFLPRASMPSWIETTGEALLPRLSTLHPETTTMACRALTAVTGLLNGHEALGGRLIRPEGFDLRGLASAFSMPVAAMAAICALS